MMATKGPWNPDLCSHDGFPIAGSEEDRLPFPLKILLYDERADVAALLAVVFIASYEGGLIIQVR